MEPKDLKFELDRVEKKLNAYFLTHEDFRDTLISLVSVIRELVEEKE